MEKYSNNENPISNPNQVFTQEEEDIIRGVALDALDSDLDGRPNYGSKRWNQAREVSDAALIRGGATWETSEPTFVLENSILTKSSLPVLEPTEGQVEALRTEMEIDILERAELAARPLRDIDVELGLTERAYRNIDAEFGVREIKTSLRRPIFKKDATANAVQTGGSQQPGYVPTLLEKLRSLFG